MGKLDGKVAIVTGAGQGIGKGIAVAMAKEGARLVIAERNIKTCEPTAEELRKIGKEALGVTCDVGDREQVIKMVNEVVLRFGTVDILVNNAQGFVDRRPAEQSEDKDWDFSYQTGAKAAWFCCTAVFTYMKDRGGKIINISSSAGTFGMEGMIIYNATKEAIKGLSRTLAREWGKYKINVNVICPLAWTEASIRNAQEYPEEYKRHVETIPLGRYGDPEKDIGRVAAFLASEDSDYVTGQTLYVEGGAMTT